MLQVGDAEKFLQALGFESLDPLLRVSQQGPCFTAMEEDRDNKRLVELELAGEADGAAPSGTAAIAEAIMIRTSAEQWPSLHRVARRYLKLVTSPHFWPFMLISALMLFVPLVMNLLLSVLTSIPYAVDLSTSLLARS